MPDRHSDPKGDPVRPCIQCKALVTFDGQPGWATARRATSACTSPGRRCCGPPGTRPGTSGGRRQARPSKASSRWPSQRYRASSTALNGQSRRALASIFSAKRTDSRDSAWSGPSKCTAVISTLRRRRVVTAEAKVPHDEPSSRLLLLEDALDGPGDGGRRSSAENCQAAAQSRRSQH